VSGENPPIKGYRRVVTDDGRVIYVPACSEDMLVAARAVVSIRKGKQHPVVFDGVFADNATIVAGSRSFKVISNDMNVEYLPDRETFVLDVSPVLSGRFPNPAIPMRTWGAPVRKRRTRRRR